MEKSGFELTVKIKFGNGMLGPGIIDFLELVGKTGSMQSACEEMKMSYSKSWRLISYAEKTVGIPLLIRESGGSQGGGSTLTKEAEDIIKSYREFVKETLSVADDKYNEIFGKFF